VTKLYYSNISEIVTVLLADERKAIVEGTPTQKYFATWVGLLPLYETMHKWYSCRFRWLDFADYYIYYICVLC